MSARPVTEHVFRVSLTMVNVFLIVLPDGITMVDAGLRRSFPRIAKAITELGRRPEDVTDILVTHLHADHTGGLAEAREATEARVWMHAADARMVAAGETRRPLKAAPGSVTGHLFGLFAGVTSATVPPVEADAAVLDAQEIPVAGGTLPLYTPGHTLGHVSYLWPRDGGVLFVGDAASRGRALKVSPVYEDYEQGVESLRRLASLGQPGSLRQLGPPSDQAPPSRLASPSQPGSLDFQVACFAHGRPITENAAALFGKTWGRS